MEGDFWSNYVLRKSTACICDSYIFDWYGIIILYHRLFYWFNLLLDSGCAVFSVVTIISEGRMSLTQEQRAARIHNLCVSTNLAIKNAYAAKVEEARDPLIKSLISGLILQVAKDARELVQEYGTNTHSYVQLDIYEQILKRMLS